VGENNNKNPGMVISNDKKLSAISILGKRGDKIFNAK